MRAPSGEAAPGDTQPFIQPVGTTPTLPTACCQQDADRAEREQAWGQHAMARGDVWVEGQPTQESVYI